MTAPYYEDDQVTLYHGDCREITEWLEADVLVTDPPYGMNFQSGQRRETFAKITGDEDTAVRDAVAALWGTDRPALMFGRWSVPAPARRGRRATSLRRASRTVPRAATARDQRCQAAGDSRAGYEPPSVHASHPSFLLAVVA